MNLSGLKIKLLAAVAAGLALTPGHLIAKEPVATTESNTGNVIFLHPDGTSLTAWNAFRVLDQGPDGMTEWDRMPVVAFYRPHVSDSIAPTSHAGGTVHAFGVKVVRDSFGKDGKQSLISASGKPYSVMQEALQRGLAAGIVNSGHLAEPGTATQLASVNSRANRTEIAKQILESGCQIILGGGEVLFLPDEVTGRHGQPGIRKDGVNLIDRAQEQGYAVVFTRDELKALPDHTGKVLGLFAAEATYHPDSEEALQNAGLDPYQASAPTVADMTGAALRFLDASGKRFFLMVEEEGTDDFANKLNAPGLFEAYRRTDTMIQVSRKFMVDRNDTLLLVASDSDASGMQTLAFGLADAEDAPAKLPPTTDVGTPLDGVEGTGSAPFVSGPDREGRRFLFGVSFSTHEDLHGGVVARAQGFNSDRVPLHLDNTGIFELIHATLFGSGD
jgi:alkaline phosphatase